ncbi:MAG: glycosyltransferase family 2 protein [Candidatus Diapherotrites archaeon]|nr:glycosyltransferase family 2 protein [Candidatus Diapherotrites archaeon]
MLKKFSLNISLKALTAFILLFIIALVLIQVFSFYWVLVFVNILFFFVSIVFLLIYFDSREKKPLNEFEWPELSIIIPVYNAENTVKNCIEAIKKMQYSKKFEIIAVNDASTDSSLKILESIKGIKIINLKKNAGKAHALNTGLKQAKGMIVACIDSDTFPSENALMLMVPQLMQSQEIAAVTGLIKVSNPDNLFAKIQEIEYVIAFGFYQSMLSAINAVIVTPGPMSIYRKQVLLDLGGYDESNITEDMEIAFRLQKHGFKITACPEAEIYTEVPLKVRHWLKQRTRWYRGKIVNLRKYRELVFNPAYTDLGMFSLPFSFSLELAAVFLLFLFAVMNLQNFLNMVLQFFSWASINTFPVISLPGLFVFHSATYFFLITILLSLIILYLSFKMINKKFQLNQLPAFLFFIAVYGLFISFAWFVSIFNELNENEYKWGTR